MPAQVGSNILLEYGPQGSQQAGSSVLLDTALVVVGVTLRRSAQAPWGRSAAVQPVVQAISQFTVAAEVASKAPWGGTADKDVKHGNIWVASDAHDTASQAPWGFYAGRAQPESLSPWALSTKSDRSDTAPWGSYTGRAEAERTSIWLPSVPKDREATTLWGIFAALQRDMQARTYGAIPADTLRWVPWTRFSFTVHGGISVTYPPGDPNEPVFTIPVKEVYKVINLVTLRRVSDNLVLKADSFNLSLDIDSWTWTFSASLSAVHLDHVKRVSPNEPVELEAIVNGHAVRVLAERVERQRTFGNTTLRLTGRGISAVLGQPYAPQLFFGNTEALTAQQVANEVLTNNEVPLGWDVDWQMYDWAVPADIWKFQGSYADALNSIAAAGGGYVQPHPTAMTLKFLKRYPVLPWNWAATPVDYELPSSAVTVEGISWESKPLYNRVFVSGTEGGVLVQATRDGTAGDVLAPMITDSLITHQDAGRGRAESVLADTGEQAPVRLRLPVFADVGFILPGSLVKYVDGGTDYYGLARAIQVEASPTESWQTIEVETHA